MHHSWLPRKKTRGESRRRQKIRHHYLRGQTQTPSSFHHQKQQQQPRRSRSADCKAGASCQAATATSAQLILGQKAATIELQSPPQ